MPTDKKSPRYRELDAFRGLAALFVVLYHFTKMYPLIYPGRGHVDLILPLNGQWAVSLFFIISGFVITLTLERCTRIGQFAASRFARLYPVYWGAVTLTMISYLLLGNPPDNPDFRRDWYLVNLTMLQSWVGVPSIDGSYWSLVPELSFYVFIGLFFRLGWLERIEWIAPAWVAIAVASHAVEAARGVEWPEMVKLTLLLEFAPLFMSGILFYRIKTGRATRRTHVLIGLFFLAFCYILPDGKRGVLVNLATFALFYLFAYGKMGWLAFEPLLSLGWISYALYLVHQSLGCGVMNLLQSRYHWSPLPSLLAAVALAIALATALTWVIERPANRFLKKVLSPKSAPASGPRAGFQDEPQGAKG